MTKKFLTMNEKRLVMNYIDVHCKKPPDSNYALYDQIAKNDQHVADLFKPSMPNINYLHVQTLRQEMELKLEPARRVEAKYVSQIDSMAEQLVKLNQIIQEHELRIHELEERATSPKVAEFENEVIYPPTIPLTRSLSPNDRHMRYGVGVDPTAARWIENAADRAVLAQVDPLTEKKHPVRYHHKGKHSK